MTTKAIHKSRRKYILLDPLAAYTNEFPDVDQEKVKHLKNLWEKYCANKKRLRAMQGETRQLSRQIGEAKRNNRSIDSLKQQMQELSTLAKNLSKRIKEIEKQILYLFETAQALDKDEQPVLPELSTRKYRGTEIKGNNVSISLLNTEYQEWNYYVENNPASSFYHRAEWKDLIQDTFGHEAYYYIARDVHARIVGILPLIRLKSRLFGDFLVSMPYFNYGGAIADQPEIEQKLMTTANNFARQLELRYIEYRDDITRSDLPARTDKVNMILALPSNENELWHKFTPKLRAQIKRPQRENPEVFISSADLLDDFYKVFSRNMRDLGTPVYHKNFFRNILMAFPQQSRILVIKWRGHAVAAAFLIGHKNTLEIPWASTLRKINHLSINMLMYWEILRFAIREGYQHFDFGRSSKDSSTYRFKQQWGAIPKPSYWHYWLPDSSELPALNPSNPKYSLLINTWKKLPVFVTRWIGPFIIKDIP